MAFCRERKQLLSGGEVTYDCELVALQDGFGLLKYVISRRYRVGSLTLLPGMISYGFYWTERPYTLYSWLTKGGDKVGYYFNLADSISLSNREFAWRDLALDILVCPSGQVEILDEEQVPPDLEKNLMSYIESAKEFVLKNHQAIIKGANRMLEKWL